MSCPHWETGGNDALEAKQAVASPTFHVGTEGRVALQTAQMVVKGANGNLRVRVLFDAGSHQSFTTSKAVRSAGLQVKRQEWINVCTFGEQTKESRLKGVYDFQVFPFQGGDGVKIKVYRVPSIAQIRNEHIETKAKTHICKVFGFQALTEPRKLLGLIY